MRIDHLLNSTLGPLVAGRFFMNTFPKSDKPPAVPAIRGTVISRDATKSICGTGSEDRDVVRVQLDVVDRNYDPMVIVRQQVIGALESKSWVRLGISETYDAETDLHRSIVDYEFFQPATNL